VRHLRALFVLRLLLVSNAVVVTAVGGICFAFVERPAGVVIASGSWVLAFTLLCLLPLTDPYRRPRRRASTGGR
jgi:hypothetical protein